MTTQSRDPLQERLDEIISHHVPEICRGEGRLQRELRALMADVAIEEHATCTLGYTSREVAERIRQRFGVGAEEKAK